MRVIITASSDSGSMGKRWVREGQQIVIGRTDQADWMIPDPSISSKHCIFRCERGQASVEDLGSTNGTWAGDQRIGTLAIESDRSIRIGSVMLSVRLENRVESKRTAKASAQDEVPAIEPAESAMTESRLQPAPPQSHTGSIRLVARTRQDHSRRLTLRSGQQAVLGGSEQVELPMTTDFSLAPQQLLIRYGDGFCRVSTLATEPPAFLGKELMTEAIILAPGDRIIVGETTLEMLAGQTSASSAPTHAIMKQPLQFGVFYCGTRAEIDLIDSQLWQSAADLIICVVWPPHPNRDPLSRAEPLYDWANPQDSPRLVRRVSEVDDANHFIAFLPRNSAASAIETVQLVARGQTKRYAAASPRLNWIGRAPKEIAELLRDGPSATRSTLLREVQWLACIDAEQWFLLGEDSLVVS